MAVQVLIVEDNLVARDFLKRVVSESFADVSGITQVSTMHDAASVLGLLPRPAGSDLPSPQPHQLILLDLELPDGHSLDLLSALGTYPATCIVTSLYSDDEHLFPALQRGADGYLLKEDRFEVLVEELQKTVRGHPPLSPALARRVLAHCGTDGHSTAPRSSSLPELSPIEAEVLTHLSKGFTFKEIASLLGIKWFTVNEHIRAIYKKLKAASAAPAGSPTTPQLSH